jgi:hypothetical protein
MATAAKAKQFKVTPTKPNAAEDSLAGVYAELAKICSRLLSKGWALMVRSRT